MDEYKKIISKMIKSVLECDVPESEIFEKIEIPKDKKNGDFAYPCFNLAKTLKNSPVNIANDVSSKIKLDSKLKKQEAINGYINFYINDNDIVKPVLSDILINGENFSNINIGNNDTVLIEYSSPNIAKPFHLGHFRNTVLGNSLYRLYKELGYNVIGINHLGDWGRQFGLVIEGYKRFNSEYDFKTKPLEALSDIYVRITKLSKEDESIMDIARLNFKKLEQGDKEYVALWQKFREISLNEYMKVYDLLGCKFDSFNGEAFYSDKLDEVVEILDKKKALTESQGAKVVMLGDNMPPCIVVKSNGSSIYATRDLAAIIYRARTYNYTKSVYITASDQILHFKQIFEVAKYLVDEKYQKGLVHVSYGMVRLKSGKMSTRDGTVVYIDELIKEACKKAKDILIEKKADVDDIDTVSKQVGIGALIFNYLKSSKIKDIIFDLDETLRFDGETGPYVQYTYVRTNSILKKSNIELKDISNIDFSLLSCDEEIVLVKCLDKFKDIIKQASSEYEPAILARYLIEVSTNFSKFYNNCNVLNCNDLNLQKARCALVLSTNIVLKKGLYLLGIECPDKM